ncbi:MAG TPA: anti-sigma regulatory factor [Thermoanaerobaculia bacterium]|jgi:serine/threonine-protein kinase RsbT|nr:anti-sigma regulatory factor [Thermoanaerobaculia bacterium]
MPNDAVVPIRSAADIVSARQEGRNLAGKIGFAGSDLTVIATAISEVARNILEHAKQGRIILDLVHHGSRVGLQVVADDSGPGIPDIPRALQDGYSTHRGLGLGLPGCRRLMDEFEIASESGRGTTVTMRKWMR